MIKRIKIQNVELAGESPYIIDIDKSNHLIGDMARALSNYIFSKRFSGVSVHAQGYYHGKDFIIERFLDLPDNKLFKVGAVLNTWG